MSDYITKAPDVPAAITSPFVHGEPRTRIGFAAYRTMTERRAFSKAINHGEPES